MKITTVFRVVGATIKIARLKLINQSNFRVKGLSSCSLSTSIRVEKGGQMSIGRHLSALRNTVLSVRAKGKLTIGNNLNMNENCSIVAHECIEIGNDVIMGPGCRIYDHDHNYKVTGKERRESFVTGSIKIGDSVWFGANCIVLKNTEIGENCAFGAGSIIQGKYEANTLIQQKTIETRKTINVLYH